MRFLSKNDVTRSALFSFLFSLFFLSALVANAQTAEPQFQEVRPRLQIPIPGFDFTSVTRPDEAGYIFVSYLPEYISAVYSYLIGVAGLFATAMIMYGGIKWIFAGGDSGKIGEAKKNIQHALIGLVLAVGSYVMLYTLNPDLVTFNALRVQSIPRIVAPEAEESDVIPEGTPSPSGVSQPTWTYATFNCADPPPAAGVVPEDQTEIIPNVLNERGAGLAGGNQRIHRSLIEPLRRLGQTVQTASEAEGVTYQIIVSSGYRSYQRQVEIWCGIRGDCASSHQNLAERKSFCAVPGYSNHGHGIALDVQLLRNGERITNFGSSSQCGLNPAYVQKLADLFYAADPGWVRYEREIWHFEYNPTTQQYRGKYTGMPAKCSS